MMCINYYSLQNISKKMYPHFDLTRFNSDLRGIKQNSKPIFSY